MDKLTIEKNADNNKLTISLKGRLDTTTAPSLESEFKSSLNGVTELIIDLKELVYISSAGLRVLLSAQKVMNKQGKMVVKNSNDDVRDVFDVTGFIDILNVEWFLYYM